MALECVKTPIDLTLLLIANYAVIVYLASLLMACGEQSLLADPTTMVANVGKGYSHVYPKIISVN